MIWWPPLTRQMAAKSSSTRAFVLRLLWFRLKAMEFIAWVCSMTMLKPNLLFMIALRHMIHTWMSSSASPMCNLAACFVARFSLGVSISKMDFRQFAGLA
uniref:Uncharacterized protein n=1 Tax=Ixodes ricinus TaxID=34613 RepID=A0A6B0U5W1_IXORI